MAYQFPPDVQQLIRAGMAFGNYATEDDVLREALHALIQRNEDFHAIKAGIADMNAGRMRPIREVDAEIRSRLGSRVSIPFEIRQLVYGLGRKRTHRAIFTIRPDQVVVLTIRHLAQSDLGSEDLP